MHTLRHAQLSTCDTLLGRWTVHTHALTLTRTGTRTHTHTQTLRNPHVRSHARTHARIFIYMQKKQFHSTETALLKIDDGVTLDIDKHKVTTLTLLDLSATFDNIDQNMFT